MGLFSFFRRRRLKRLSKLRGKSEDVTGAVIRKVRKTGMLMRDNDGNVCMATEKGLVPLKEGELPPGLAPDQFENMKRMLK